MKPRTAPGTARTAVVSRIAAALLVALSCTGGVVHARAESSEQPAAAEQPAQPYLLKMPGSLATLNVLPIPAPGSALPVLWMSATEVTWDAYDAFRLGQDKPGAGAKSPADAVSRPSHPYGDPDRGFGHKGYPAISVTYYGAKEFCRWLSQATGAKYRLPTEAEWENACRTGAATGAAAAPPIDSVAWHSGNAGGKTHPVGKKAPNAWGLLDMLGNAGEWCTGKDGKPVLCGGTYLDPPSKVSPATRARQTAEWNERDPQLPKSKWWLSDGPFAGFRIVREP